MPINLKRYTFSYQPTFHFNHFTSNAISTRPKTTAFSPPPGYTESMAPSPLPVRDAIALYNRPLTTPIYPNFHLCDPFYGENLYVRNCRDAAITLLAMDYDKSYTTTSSEDSFPIMASSGRCHITAEVAGPSIPSALRVSAEGFAQMITWVISECVVRRNGMGGFVTNGLHNLVTYTTNPAFVLSAPYPVTTYFMTVTISDSADGKQPGDHDPSVPQAISNYNVYLNRNSNIHNSPEAIQSEDNIQMWSDVAARMGRGETVTWWQTASPSVKDEMNYECDNSLGSPAEVDCTQIEWNQLTPTSDTLTVGPGDVTFLHSNTCFLAISASVSLVLNWSQIRTAVASLMNACVQAPYDPPQGGRAYYRPTQQISNRKEKRDSLTGWNALPQHANITLFQQQEPWIDSASELQTCAWKAVTSGQSVMACPKT